MSMRRYARLRREYLYKKSLEGKEKAAFDKKRKIKEAFEEGKTIPTELRGEEAALRHQIEMEDIVTEKDPSAAVDDEYATAGHQDPQICITTSRDPSSRLKQFSKELKLIFPNAQRVNRGGTKIEDMVRVCRQNGFTDIVIAQETRGEPDGLVVSHLPFGPTVYFSLSNCVLRHDIPDRGTISEAYPHIILNNLKSKMGKRIGTVLKHLFPVPKPESKRIVTMANENDFISFRHHIYQTTTTAASATGDNPATPDSSSNSNSNSGNRRPRIELVELGPRMEMMPYQIRLGTVDQGEAENEWVLRPYLNTAKKRRVL